MWMYRRHLGDIIFRFYQPYSASPCGGASEPGGDTYTAKGVDVDDAHSRATGVSEDHDAHGVVDERRLPAFEHDGPAQRAAPQPFVDNKSHLADGVAVDFRLRSGRCVGDDG